MILQPQLAPFAAAFTVHTPQHIHSLFDTLPASAGIMNRNNNSKTYECWTRSSVLLVDTILLILNNCRMQLGFATSQLQSATPCHHSSPGQCNIVYHYRGQLTITLLLLLPVSEKNHPRSKNSTWMTQCSDTLMNDASDWYILFIWAILGPIKNLWYAQEKDA
jgi:hypothetical protein